MPNKEVSSITLEIGDMIETYDLTDSNNPVIELKDTVTENATAGTEQHVFKETTADGHENQISDFLIAQKQISALRTNSTGDGLVMESYDQKAAHQQTDLRLAQVTTNKNNIATAQSDIRGLQTSVSQAEKDIADTPSIINTDTGRSETFYGLGCSTFAATSLWIYLPLNISKQFKKIELSNISGSARGNSQYLDLSKMSLNSVNFKIGSGLYIIMNTDSVKPQASATYFITFTCNYTLS